MIRGGPAVTAGMYGWFLQATHSVIPSQSFIGHTDSVTGLAWADDNTLISTGAGDAVLIWHVTPCAITAAAATAGAGADPIAANTVSTDAATCRNSTTVDKSPAFGSFPFVEPGLLQQSLEAFAGASQPTGFQLNSMTAVELDGSHMQAVSARDMELFPNQSAAAVDGVQAAGQLQLADCSEPAGPCTSAQTPAASPAKPTAVAEVPEPPPAQGEAAEAEPALAVRRVVGFNGDSCGSCAWLAETGVLIYAAEQVLIVEQLATRQQRSAPDSAACIIAVL